MFRQEAADTRNNRKCTRGRKFAMAPVKGIRKNSRAMKVFEATRFYQKQDPQPYVGIADFGAMRRGYHTNRGPKA